MMWCVCVRVVIGVLFLSGVFDCVRLLVVCVDGAAHDG